MKIAEVIKGLNENSTACDICEKLGVIGENDAIHLGQSICSAGQASHCLRIDRARLKLEFLILYGFIPEDD